MKQKWKYAKKGRNKHCEWCWKKLKIEEHFYCEECWDKILFGEQGGVVR